MWLNVEHLILNHIIYSREPLKVLTNNLCRALTLDVLSSSWATNSIDDSSTLDSNDVVVYQHIPFSPIRILKTFHHNGRISVNLNWSTSLRSLLRHDQIYELLSVQIIFNSIDRHSFVPFLTDVISWDSCDWLHTIYLLKSCLSWV